MADESNNTVYTTFQRAFIAAPSDRVARTDTLTDEALSACRADCDTTWQTNWYQQQADLLIGKWVACEAEADRQYTEGMAACNQYGDWMYRGICMNGVRNRVENYKTSCVLNNAIAVNDGLKSPTNYVTSEKLSWYDGRGVCLNYIAMNAKSKSDICKNKNCR